MLSKVLPRGHVEKQSCLGSKEWWKLNFRDCGPGRIEFGKRNRWVFFYWLMLSTCKYLEKRLELRAWYLDLRALCRHENCALAGKQVSIEYRGWFVGQSLFLSFKEYEKQIQPDINVPYFYCFRRKKTKEKKLSNKTGWLFNITVNIRFYAFNFKGLR